MDIIVPQGLKRAINIDILVKTGYGDIKLTVMNEQINIVPAHPPFQPIPTWGSLSKEVKTFDINPLVRCISHHLNGSKKRCEQIIKLIAKHPQSEGVWSALKSYGVCYQGYVLEILQKNFQKKLPENEKLKEDHFFLQNSFNGILDVVMKTTLMN